MTDRKTSKKLIANAVIWAAMMIAVSHLTKGSENSQFIVMLMIMGWFGTQNLISPSNATAECAALRRMFARGPKF